MPEPVLRALREQFSPDFSSLDPGDFAEYGRDWTRVFVPAPSAVAFPRTTDEVSRLLALCNDVGLLAEEYDPVRGRQVGNFPQAFSHVALVNTIHNLSRGTAGPAHARANP